MNIYEQILWNIEILRNLSNFHLQQKLTLIEEFMGYRTIRIDKLKQKECLVITMKGQGKSSSTNLIFQKLDMNSEVGAVLNFENSLKTLKLIFYTIGGLWDNLKI